MNLGAHITVLEVISVSDLHKRVISGIAMGLIALAAFIFWDGLLFKIIYGLVALLALAELLANYHIVRLYTNSTFYVIFECLMTIFGAYVICFHFSRATIIAAIVIAFTNDIGAYFVGKFLHGKYFKSRPFPTASPNKSWEGLISGAIFGIIGCVICLYLDLIPTHNTVFWFILALTGWLVAVVGDWLESKTKRKLGIKDSGDTLRETPILRIAEKVAEGHGGFLDRIDSLNAVAIFIFILLQIF